MKSQEKIKSVKEYIDTIGISAFTALCLVQTVLAVYWLVNNLVVVENGAKTVFRYKELISVIFMFATALFLLMTIVKKVIGSKVKIYCIIPIALYIVTLPTVMSVHFDSTLFAICVSLLLLLLTFTVRYFYGEHERRLYQLLGILAILILLSYLNRPSFWAGIAETFLFLTIQLIRNIGIRRKNIGDKSWRNTLLLFCILIIIMLLPQYCTYNNIKHTLYHQPLEEQVAARVIVPYLEYEKNEKHDEYLLGVIRNADYGLGHPYRNFKKIIHRYEEDNLDMDTIWKNLYKNAYYRYKKTIVKRYVRDVLRGFAAPFITGYEMKSERLVSHHGYYYGLFEKEAPYASNIYMKFSLGGLFMVCILTLLQTIARTVNNAVQGKYKIKLEEGRHKKIEAVLLTIFLGLIWTAFQTLFSLEGTSYTVSIGSTIIWVICTSFIWYPTKTDQQNDQTTA